MKYYYHKLRFFLHRKTRNITASVVKEYAIYVLIKINNSPFHLFNYLSKTIIRAKKAILPYFPKMRFYISRFIFWFIIIFLIVYVSCLLFGIQEGLFEAYKIEAQTLKKNYKIEMETLQKNFIDYYKPTKKK